MYFVYAHFETKFQAEDALERYFANGEICEAERPRIERRKLNGWKTPRYCVMFPG
jgi:hypothetical protein